MITYSTMEVSAPLNTTHLTRDENGRVRTLHALGARDKVITTLFIDELHRVLSPHFYDNSYSYRYTLPDSEDITLRVIRINGDSMLED